MYIAVSLIIKPYKMELKLVLKTKITKEFLNPVNLIATKLSYGSVYELWQNIQHIDTFFDDDHTDGGVNAKYDEVCKIIDFRDIDGTLIFYVTK